jgi:redox-sensing transcriptional repressor
MKSGKNNTTGLPVPTIRRLPLYLSFLKSTKNKKRVFISAPEIAKELHIDATQITKDFSFINVSGKTKVGYKTNDIIRIIENFLGYHEPKKAFLVGVGNLGMALIKYNAFSKEGLKITVAFDIATEKVAKDINNIKVFNINEFEKEFIEAPVEIGIITVPSDHAQKVADIMIKCGIKAIWNFSATPISVPNNIIVENTSIDSGLAMITWKLNKNKPLIYKNRIL